MEALILQPKDTLLIGFDGVVVGFAIHFDDKACSEADEIGHIMANRILAAKSQRTCSFGPELLPKTLLRHYLICRRKVTCGATMDMIPRSSGPLPYPLPQGEGVAKIAKATSGYKPSYDHNHVPRRRLSLRRGAL